MPIHHPTRLDADHRFGSDRNVTNWLVRAWQWSRRATLRENGCRLAKPHEPSHYRPLRRYAPSVQPQTLNARHLNSLETKDREIRGNDSG